MATSTHNSADVARSIFRIARRIRPARWLGLIAILLIPSVAIAAPKGPRFVPGRILVQPKNGLAETNFVGKLARHSAAPGRLLHHLNVRVIALPEEETEAALAALRADPDIEFAERDYIAETAFAPDDPYVVSGTAWHLARIHTGEAWDFTTGLADTVVGVLDSGINAAHPDLAGRVLPGFDFVGDDSDPADDFGHGTAVAGTIVAAGNNGTGAAGVAFGCRVLPVKVVDASGFATYSSLAQGIKYAVDHGARIINISVAGPSPSITLQDAVNYAWAHNVVIVAAAGNDGNTVLQYPAACDHVIAVSATQSDDALAAFSSYGNHIALAAPGDRIWTTQRDLNNPYAAWRGTSFASPIVAGVAALVVSENPSLSNTQIVSLLEQTADDLGAPGNDPAFGHGLVNAFRAVTAASLEPGSLPPTTPPSQSTNEPPVFSTDTHSPSVAIVHGPENRARLWTPQVTLSGQARDDAGLREIQVQVNGITQLADGTTNWSVQVALSPGPNLVSIRSVDLAGNASAGVTRRFTYVVRVPVSIQTNGIGEIIPDLDGKRLEIGQAYTIKAVPGPGQVFAGWNGAAASSRQLTFLMQSNLALTANFVPTPFPPVHGGYAGLVANTNGVTPESSAYFSLALTSLGRFTGSLLLAGKRLGFQGRFNLAGDAVVTVKRPYSHPLLLTLHVELENPADQVTGSLTDGAWTSELAADRDVFSARFNPAPQAGRRAFILERANDTAPITAATGSGTIFAGGVTEVKGRLEDRRAFTAGSSLSKNGDYPFYLSFRRGHEVVIGWLNFPAADPAASGTVLWVRTGTNAFATILQATAR